MTKEFFEKVESLLTVLDILKKTGYAKLDAEQQHTLRYVYNTIHPGIQLDLGCSTCISHYLNMLLAWYEREKPKYDASQVSNSTEVQTTTTAEPVDKKKSVRRKK